MKRRVEYVWCHGNWYHPNFFTRGPWCIKRAKYTCLHCGRKRGDAYITEKGKPDTIVIQAAHVNHDPKNPRAKLMALCKPCHMSYDGYAHWKTKRRKAREAQLGAGQLELPLFKQRSRKVS